MTKISRIARLATLPETRGLVVAAARSHRLRDIVRRAREDRAGLFRDVRNPAIARELVRDAIRHPATEEVATAGLMFLPWRFLPVGWAALWAARKVLGRHVDPPTAWSTPRPSDPTER